MEFQELEGNIVNLLTDYHFICSDSRIATSHAHHAPPRHNPILTEPGFGRVPPQKKRKKKESLSCNIPYCSDLQFSHVIPLRSDFYFYYNHITLCKI